MTENMPSSVRFGVRPRIATARSNSSAVMPISAANFGVTLEPREVVIPAVAGGGVVRIALNAPGASNELRPR